ncbi:E3 ubiquitin-protein ligase UPL4-like isoform X2 [Chenopodium quinoa]|uniref:E3 ubiquitin-protein ligase UPL4-like isoform X2 n=1 Tax=Chenopodium quinoa TaxID=63459 RepID=UPI000B791A6F|nr:E3 ubiquitin-protein ligase UPL4-like isoform X2 [Chenopodium quinoa]
MVDKLMGDSITESRGQKRIEMAEDLPADKRACSSLEFRPSSSTVTPETIVNATSTAFEMRVGDMETSSSSAASASGHSEGDGERDSPYGSCDSDDMEDDDDDRYSSLRELQRSRSQSDSAKFDGIVSCLSNDAEPSGQLAALTELCELLSFCTEDSISSLIADRFTSALVKLAKHENSPDIMLLSIRALTYLCDVYPRSSSLLVRHEAVPTLCERLLIIDYLDVAEQCLQALEKISRDQPLPCLQSGAITAVLGYIDFFSTTVQRTALRTVVNICKKLPSECPSPVMEAVPRLCMLLQYEDQQLVELVAICLIKVGDCVKDSLGMLSELYGHGLINQVIHLIDLNSRITLSQPTYTGLVGLVAKIASRSADAVRTLFELNIGRIVKDVLSNSDNSRVTPSPRTKDSNCSLVHEVLKLLHGLLPEVVRDKKEELLSSTDRILLDQPDIMQEFGTDILPTLVQVVSSGANLYVCYGCLSVISRLFYYSKPETLLKLFGSINIASFLAGIFTRNDHHVLVLALQIADTVLEKLSNVLMQSFIKEGVLFAIDNLLMPDSCSQQTFPMTGSSQSKKIAVKEVVGCLCYIYHTRKSQSTIDSEKCKANKESVISLAEHLKTNYFSVELHSSQSMVTDLLEDLRNASHTMNDFLNISLDREAGAQREERLCSILDKVILQLGGNVPVSTFELIESGIMKALLNYLSNGQFLSSSYISDDLTQAYGVQKRFEAFARMSLSSPDPTSQDLPLSLLVRKLHRALSTVETMTVMTGYATKQRGSYATVPNGRSTAYPSLKVRFVRGEEELCLGDYLKDAVTVDPFCLVEEIEQYLQPKVGQTRKESSEAGTQAFLEAKTESNQAPLNAASHSCKGVKHLGSGSTCTVTPDLQENGDDKSHSSAMDISDVGQTKVIGAEVSSEVQSGSLEEEIPLPNATENLIETSSTCLCGDNENSRKGLSQASFNKEDIPSKLALYLNGELLESSSTLYQEILERRVNGSKLWTSTHTITYRRVAGNETSSLKESSNMYGDAAIDKVLLCRQVMPLFSNIFSHGLGSKLGSSSTSSDILLLLRCLEMMNRFSYHLVSYERMNAFAEGKIDDLDELKVALPRLSQYEFVSSRLTDKLEQQMRDPSSVHVGAMPLWCSQLIARCPFLFSFEARCKFFQLAAFGKVQIPPNMSSPSDSNSSRDRRASVGSPPRKKFLVCRERVLESAAQMMDLSAQKKVVIEVEYSEEVGTGLGPTLEFYTLVSHEFQKAGLGMWRGDYISSTNSCRKQDSSSRVMVSTSGLFPRPWSQTSSDINGIEFSDVIKKFKLLGQIVGKALQDGRVLDIPFSVAFYKLVLGKELSLCDIQSFDPDLGRILLEFKALVNRQKCESACGDNTAHVDGLRFRCTKIEDLCLDYTLPGYPEYVLSSGMADVMVNINNLEEYISFVLDATLQTGISRQVEAFKSGLNQAISDKHLQLFTEEELERLLCGEHDSWLSVDLFDHIKFDHGYTAGSTPIINLLEVISEFTYEQRRAFLQFVTGAPRLPPGGLAALNPKLTIVRKHSSNFPDADLPSVMTCANYLKLPPYSSKENLKEKLLYAITEGQGSFHLS